MVGTLARRSCAIGVNHGRCTRRCRAGRAARPRGDCRSANSRPRCTGSLVGIGMNVNRQTWSADLAASATSLCVESGAPFARNQLTARLLNTVETEIERAKREGAVPIINKLNQHLALRGRRVRVEKNVGTI